MPDWRFKILIDGACPLCRREAAMMRRMDRGRGALVTEDISDSGFDASAYGVSLERLMGTIHGVLPDGRLVTGMEVFRRAYGAVGWGWLLAPTAWPGLRCVFDGVYAFFARHRLSLTGRRCDAQGRCRVEIERKA